MAEFKLILITVVRWVIFGGCAALLIYQLIQEVELPLPATRSSYLIITLQSLGLFNLWIISWTLYLQNMLVDHVGETRKMFFGELHAILAAVETRLDLSRPPTPLTLDRMSSFVDSADSPHPVRKAHVLPDARCNFVSDKSPAADRQGYIAENAPLW